LAQWVGAAAAEAAASCTINLISLLKAVTPAAVFCDEERAVRWLDPGAGKDQGPDTLWGNRRVTTRPWGGGVNAAAGPPSTGESGPPAVGLLLCARVRGGRTRPPSLLNGFNGILAGSTATPVYKEAWPAPDTGLVGPVTLPNCWSNLRRQFYEGPMSAGKRADRGPRHSPASKPLASTDVEAEISVASPAPPKYGAAPCGSSDQKPVQRSLEGPWFEDNLARIVEGPASSPKQSPTVLNHWDGPVPPSSKMAASRSISNTVERFDPGFLL